MATMELLSQIRDNQKNPVTGAFQQSGNIHAAKLAQGVCQRYAIPDGANFVVFGSTIAADYYVMFQASSAAISIPGANITDGTAPEVNPVYRIIRKTDKYISLIASIDCIITMAFYGGEVRQ